MSLALGKGAGAMVRTRGSWGLCPEASSASDQLAEWPLTSPFPSLDLC